MRAIVLWYRGNKMYKHYESKKEILEDVEKILEGRKIWKVEIKGGVLWRKPKPGEGSVHWKHTGKTTMILEVFEPCDIDED